MKFTIERRELVRMVKLLRGTQIGSGPGVCLLRLNACAPYVSVEAEGLCAGFEALVLEDGSCVLPRVKWLAIVQSFRRKKNVTVEASAGGIRIGTFEMPVRGYSSEVTPPLEIQTPPVTDAWLAPAGAPKPPAANVPCAAPDESSASTEPEKSRWLSQRWWE